MLGELDPYPNSTIDELEQAWMLILLPGVISSHLKWGEDLKSGLSDGGFLDSILWASCLTNSLLYPFF